MFSRALRAAFVALAVVSPLAAASAHAQSLPVDAEVRAGRFVEPADFRQLVAIRYNVEFKKVVAADIDSDGDIDVLATTDRTFTVWVNDGAGHLTSQRPTHAPGVDATSPATTWRGGDDRSEPSTKDDAPTASILTDRAHGPPVLAASAAATREVSLRLAARISSSAPRAPPA